MHAVLLVGEKISPINGGSYWGTVQAFQSGIGMFWLQKDIKGDPPTFFIVKWS